jgi:hypothetical protein
MSMFRDRPHRSPSVVPIRRAWRSSWLVGLGNEEKERSRELFSISILYWDLNQCIILLASKKHGFAIRGPLKHANLRACSR